MLNEEPLHGAVASEVEQIIRSSYSDPDFECDMQPASVRTFSNGNNDFVEQYEAKKAALGQHSREGHAFVLAKGLPQVKGIARRGLVTGQRKSVLGDRRKGVSLSRNVDVQHKLAEEFNLTSYFIVILKVNFGREKQVTPAAESDELPDPSPGYECHLSSEPVERNLDVSEKLRRSQAYFYDLDGQNTPLRRPRHILPHAVVEFKRSGDIAVPDPNLLDPIPAQGTQAGTREGESSETRECSSDVVPVQEDTSQASNKSANDAPRIPESSETREDSSDIVPVQESTSQVSDKSVNDVKAIPEKDVHRVNNSSTLSEEDVSDATNETTGHGAVVENETVNITTDKPPEVCSETHNLPEHLNEPENLEQPCNESESPKQRQDLQKQSSQSENVVHRGGEVEGQIVGDHSLSVTSSNEDPSIQGRGRKRHLSDNTERSGASSSKETVNNEKRMRHSSSSGNTTQPHRSRLLVESTNCSVRSGGEDLQGDVLSISENPATKNSLSENAEMSKNDKTSPVVTTSSTINPTADTPTTLTNASSLRLSTQLVAQLRSNWSNVSRSGRLNQSSSSPSNSDDGVQATTISTVAHTTPTTSSSLPVSPPISNACTVAQSQNNAVSSSNLIVQNPTPPSMQETSTSSITFASLVVTSVRTSAGNQELGVSTRQLGTAHIEGASCDMEGQNSISDAQRHAASTDSQPLQSHTLWSNLSDAQKKKIVEARKKCFAWWRQYAHLMRENDSKEALDHILNCRLSSFRSIYSRYSTLIAQCITNYQSRQPSTQVPHVRQSSNCRGNEHSQWLAAEQQQQASPIPQSNALPHGNHQVRPQHPIPGAQQMSAISPMQQQMYNGNAVQMHQQQPTVHPNHQGSQLAQNPSSGMRGQQPQPQQCQQQQWSRMPHQPIHNQQQQQQVIHQQRAAFTSANQSAHSNMYGQQQLSQVYGSQQTQQGNQAAVQSQPVGNNALQGLQNMCQNQQYDRTNTQAAAPPSYNIHLQQRHASSGHTVARQSNRMPTNYHTQRMPNNISAGSQAPGQPGYSVPRDSGCMLPGYATSARPAPQTVEQNPRLSRLLFTTESNSRTASCYNRQHQGTYSQNTPQVHYPPNVTAPVNRYQTGVNLSSMPHSGSGHLNNQNRPVGTTVCQASVPVPVSSRNIPSISPVRLPVSQTSPQGRTISAVATTTFNPHVTVNRTACTRADLSALSSHGALVNSAIVNISPPARDAAIAGCPTDVHPIVIAPVDDMPPTPAPCTFRHVTQSSTAQDEAMSMAPSNESVATTSTTITGARQMLQRAIKQERAPSRSRTSEFVDLTSPQPGSSNVTKVVNLDSPVEQEVPSSVATEPNAQDASHTEGPPERQSEELQTAAISDTSENTRAQAATYNVEPSNQVSQVNNTTEKSSQGDRATSNENMEQKKRRVIGTLCITYGDHIDKKTVHNSNEKSDSRDAAASDKPLNTTTNPQTASSGTTAKLSAATSSLLPSPRPSDILASPGARSDITVAYEDPEAPPARTPSPTRFLSPTGGPSLGKRSANRDVIPTGSTAAYSLRFDENEDLQSSTSQNTSQPHDHNELHRITDPVHPSTPCPVHGQQTDVLNESNDDLLENTNIFAQRADPFHMPLPLHVRTDSPVSATLLNRSRNMNDALVSPRRHTSVSDTLTAPTPPPPSPFSTLTSSPETLTPPIVTEEDKDKQRLISSARNRINQEVERRLGRLSQEERIECTEDFNGDEECKREIGTSGDSDYKIWREIKLDSVDDDDLSLPDIPNVAPETVTRETMLPQPVPQRFKHKSGTESIDSVLSDSDGSTASSKGTTSTRGKGKAGGRGGKAKIKSQPQDLVTEHISPPRKEKKIRHGLIKKGALQAALKLNQERNVQNPETPIVEMKPTSTAAPRHTRNEQGTNKLSVKQEKQPMSMQQTSITDVGLDDDVIIDVEMTPGEISIIDKAAGAQIMCTDSDDEDGEDDDHLEILYVFKPADTAYEIIKHETLDEETDDVNNDNNRNADARGGNQHEVSANTPAVQEQGSQESNPEKTSSKVGGEQDVDEESPVPVTEEEYIDVEGYDNNEKDVTVAVQRAILPYQIREEVVAEEQVNECTDDEAFAEQPAVIPGLGSPLHVIQPDDPTPPQSPDQETMTSTQTTQPKATNASEERDNGAEAAPVISSRNISEAAQKRATEIVKRLGNDDLYEEDERDRARTVEDIIASDKPTEQTEKEPETITETENVAPDENELNTEHVDVDPDLNELYLKKAKITEKLLMGDDNSDDDASSHDVNDEKGEAVEEETEENDDQLLDSQTSVNEETEDIQDMDISEEMEEELLNSPDGGKEIDDAAEADAAEDKSLDANQVAEQNEKTEDEFDVRGGRQYRKRSEEGEVSDSDSEISIDLMEDKRDINEEITEDWNFLDRDTQKRTERNKRKVSPEPQKRSKKKKKKRGKHRHHRDRSSDTHRNKRETEKCNKDSHNDKNQGALKDTDKVSHHDRKRKCEDEHEKEKDSQRDEKTKRIKAKFEAPLIVNTLMKATKQTYSSDKQPQLFDAYQENKTPNEQKVHSEIPTAASVPKLDTKALREILEKVTKATTVPQNVSNEDNSETFRFQGSAVEKSGCIDQRRRRDISDPQSDDYHSSPTTASTDNTAPKAREPHLGTVELLAWNRGLPIPGAEPYGNDEAPDIHHHPEVPIPRPRTPLEPILHDSHQFSSDSQIADIRSQSDSTSGTKPSWERNRPFNQGMKRPPWEMKKQQKVEGAGDKENQIKDEQLSASDDKKFKTEQNNSSTILFHGSGSLKTGKAGLASDASVVTSDNKIKNVYDLSQKAPWQNKRVPSSTTTLHENVTNSQENGTSDNIADPWPQHSKTKDSPESLHNVALKAPWQNKASQRKISIAHPVSNKEHQDENEEKETPSESLQSLAKRAPWQRRTSQNSDTRSDTGLDQDKSITQDSARDLNTLSDERSGSDSKISPATSSEKNSAVTYNQDQQAEMKNQSKKIENMPKPIRMPSGDSLIHGKRRRSSQMSECSSDTCSLTSSSPRSHVGHSPASSTGSMHRQDPERDQEIFITKRLDLLKEIDAVFKEIKENQTEEGVRRFDAIKWEIQKITLDIEINKLNIHKKKEGNTYQVNSRLPNTLLLETEISSCAQVSACSKIPLYLIRELKGDEVNTLTKLKMDIETVEKEMANNARPKNEEERKALQQNVDFLHRRREARLKEFCGPGTITDTIEKMKKELDRYSLIIEKLVDEQSRPLREFRNNKYPYVKDRIKYLEEHIDCFQSLRNGTARQAPLAHLTTSTISKTDKQGMPTGDTSGQRQLQNVPKNSPVLHQSSYHPLQAATSTSEVEPGQAETGTDKQKSREISSSPAQARSSSHTTHTSAAEHRNKAEATVPCNTRTNSGKTISEISASLPQAIPECTASGNQNGDAVQTSSNKAASSVSKGQVNVIDYEHGKQVPTGSLPSTEERNCEASTVKVQDYEHGKTVVNYNHTNLKETPVLSSTQNTKLDVLKSNSQVQQHKKLEERKQSTTPPRSQRSSALSRSSPDKVPTRKRTSRRKSRSRSPARYRSRSKSGSRYRSRSRSWSRYSDDKYRSRGRRSSRSRSRDRGRYRRGSRSPSYRRRSRSRSPSHRRRSRSRSSSHRRRSRSRSYGRRRRSRSHHRHSRSRSRGSRRRSRSRSRSSPRHRRSRSRSRGRRRRSFSRSHSRSPSRRRQHSRSRSRSRDSSSRSRSPSVVATRREKYGGAKRTDDVIVIKREPGLRKEIVGVGSTSTDPIVIDPGDAIYHVNTQVSNPANTTVYGGMYQQYVQGYHQSYQATSWQQQQQEEEGSFAGNYQVYPSTHISAWNYPPPQ